MKQLLLEISIWVFTFGLLINIWFLQVLIQKIRQLDEISTKLRDKFGKIKYILKGYK